MQAKMHEKLYTDTNTITTLMHMPCFILMLINYDILFH